MTHRPRLTRDLLVDAQFVARTGAALPTSGGQARPERIMQFGSGAFLRAFLGDIIDAANARGAFDGSIVVVGTTGSARGALLTEQGGLYAVSEQGVAGGAAVDALRVLGATSRALDASEDWDAVLALARTPALRLVVSNTTEVGLSLVAGDVLGATAPQSFPAKLTHVLLERWRARGAEAHSGLTILPCELVPDNGPTLQALVLQQAKRWALDGEFANWVATRCRFCSTLVDRIVPGVACGDEAERLEARLGARDALLTVCEPYRLFAIEGDAALRAALGFADGDPTVVVAPDISPYRTRKVRVLNGGHTASVAAGLLCGVSTVRELVTDARLGAFVRRAIFDEIVPSLDVDGGEAFARDVLDRFANPRIRHALADITLQGTAKMRARVIPSVVSFTARTGRAPQALAFGVAAHLLFLRGDLQTRWASEGRPVPLDTEGAVVRDAWQGADTSSPKAREAFVGGLCGNAVLWGTDLSALPGFASAVAGHLGRLLQGGVNAALDVLLATQEHG